MARQFGVISTNGSLAASLLQNITKSSSAEIAEAQNEKGKRTDMIAYSRTETISCDFVMDTGDTLPQVGSKVTIGGVEGLVTEISINESNTAYTSGSMTIETKDSAALVDYASSGGLGS